MAVHNGSIVVSIIPLSCLLGLHAGTVLHAEGPFFFKDIFLNCLFFFLPYFPFRNLLYFIFE
uniref:Uncharacterized protein n=1 Tax=Amphiprion ocellaris TaxID=80972 RepID=A0AAQ6AIY0_AMPOC